MDDIEWPEEPPEVDVWNHIQTGLDLADEELGALPVSLRTLTEQLGRAIVEIRSRAVIEDPQHDYLHIDEYLLTEPWVRYAADLYIATEGIRRATDALARYLDLKPSGASRGLPDDALSYVREAVHTYIFGFDAACIALCRAALEQMLKAALIAKGVFTKPQLKRDRPTAGTLLENAKRAGLLRDHYHAAERVVKSGDTLMHSHLYDEKILKQMARDSVRDLTEALAALVSDRENG
jgi:hypothetical protein